MKDFFSSEAIIYTIGAGFFMLILNPNSDGTSIILSMIIGYQLHRYFKIKGELDSQKSRGAK